MRTGATATPSGRELLDTMETLAEAFARLERIFAAWTQQKDGAAGNATDHVTPAGMFGFVTSADILDSATALAAYNEINSFIGNGGPSLKQACAKLKQ
jgi:hypothetical protein